MNKEEKKALLSLPEYEFLKTDPNLRQGVCLLGLAGSHAYGTNVPTSDIDVRGIAYNTKESLLGLTPFEQVVDKDTDSTVYALNKVIPLFANCNPSILDMVGLREEDYLFLDKTGRALIEKQEMFYSKQAQFSFGGYASAQLRRLQNALAHDAYPRAEKQKHIANTLNVVLNTFNNRYQEQYGIKVYLENDNLLTDMDLKKYPLEQAHGMLSEMTSVIREYQKLNHRNRKKDDMHLNKHAMHLVRLFYTGTELLETGRMHTYREKEHDLLMDIRAGKYQRDDHTYRDEFFELVNELEKNFQYAAEHTVLPDKPRWDEIQDFVMKVNRETIERTAEPARRPRRVGLKVENKISVPLEAER